jgi:hypothetical protein
MIRPQFCILNSEKYKNQRRKHLQQASPKIVKNTSTEHTQNDPEECGSFHSEIEWSKTLTVVDVVVMG